MNSAKSRWHKPRSRNSKKREKAVKMAAARWNKSVDSGSKEGNSLGLNDHMCLPSTSKDNSENCKSVQKLELFNKCNSVSEFQVGTSTSE